MVHGQVQGPPMLIRAYLLVPPCHRGLLHAHTVPTRRFATDADASRRTVEFTREPCSTGTSSHQDATAHPCGSLAHPRHVASRESTVKISEYHPGCYQMRPGDQQGPRIPPTLTGNVDRWTSEGSSHSHSLATGLTEQDIRQACRVFT